MFVFICYGRTGHIHKSVTFTFTAIKVKESLLRPGQALRVPGGCGSQISRQSGDEGGRVVSPMNWPPLPPRIHMWYSVSARG